MIFLQNVPEFDEVPSEYQPPKWLSEVIPRKAPYYPQMGDQIMFFQQGYKYYLEAVKTKDVYKVAGRQGISKLKLPEPVLVKVCVKLQRGRRTFHNFTLNFTR